MIFFESNDYDGLSNYDAPVPVKFRTLLLTGFHHRFATGSWGSYLSLWLETENFVFYLHYFFRLRPGKMFAEVPVTIYAINHMQEGRVFGMLNNGVPVELGPDRSHFFVIPGGHQQYVLMNKEHCIAMHINYKRHYLDRNQEHYELLQPMLQQYDAHPDQALHASLVLHDHLRQHSWRKVYETILHVANPVLYLEAQARELMRQHYEQLEEIAVFRENDVDPAKVTPGQLKKIHVVRLLLEQDITVTHSLSSLSREINLNLFDLKRIFREVYKTSIHQYLVGLRMQHARELVMTTTLSNQQIADQCGMSNIPYFCTCFKKYFGQTIREMRSNARNRLS